VYAINCNTVVTVNTGVVTNVNLMQDVTTAGKFFASIVDIGGHVTLNEHFIYNFEISIVSHEINLGRGENNLN
jgi:hypothetical protein